MSLRGREEFRRVLSEGTRARRGPLAVTVAPGADPSGPARLGIAVRVARGRAVVRNRIRRRVKEAFRSAARPGRDVVVRADDRVLGMSFQELTVTLEGAMADAERGS